MSSLTTPSCTNIKAFTTVAFNDIIADTDFFAIVAISVACGLVFFCTLFCATLCS